MKLNYAYFIGIKGVGMATLAVIAREAGIKVGGSDVGEEFITDSILKKSGIKFDTGFLQESIRKFLSGAKKEKTLIIVTGAHGGLDNPQAVVARELGYKVLTHGQAVGLFMQGEVLGKKDIQGVSVSGSHGKTTITAFLAAAATLSGLAPSYTAGTSEIFPIGFAGHFGKGKLFIAEADEYLTEPKYDRTAKFLYQKPQVLIINNVDFDHPDFYKNLDEVKSAYKKLIENLDDSATLIINGDDPGVREVVAGARQRIIKYGSTPSNDFIITRFTESGMNSFFDVESNGTKLGTFNLSVPGFHNAKNSLAVIAFLIDYGVSIATIQKVLPEFKGTKRRIEIIGETKDGKVLIDDYAHHPEEIQKSLEALKEAYVNKKIICIFQSHTYSRTAAMSSQFVASFSNAHQVIILPVFASMREKEDGGQEVEKEIMAQFESMSKNAVFLKFDDVVKYVDQNFQGDSYVVVTMGAGDVYKIGYQLKSL